MRNVYKDRPMRLVQLTSCELRSFAEVFSHGIEIPCLEALLTWLPDRLTRPAQLGPWTQHSATQFYRDLGFDVPPPATLCKGHNTLNAALVQDALAGVLSEADENIEELVESIGGTDKIPERLRHRVIDEAQAFLAADSTITEGEFYYFHKRQPPGLWWNRRDLHPCCLLGKIANTPSLLSALRACQLASLPDESISGQNASVRLTLIESWIYALEPKKALDVISISSAYSNQLRALRRSGTPKQLKVEQQPLMVPSQSHDLAQESFYNNVPIGNRRPVSSFYGPPQTSAPDLSLPATPSLTDCSSQNSNPDVSWDRRAALRLSDMSPPPIDYDSKPIGNYRLPSWNFLLYDEKGKEMPL